MDDLKKWLENKEPVYAEGLILLAKYGRNRILLQNLNRREHMKKLRYELEKIYGHHSTDKKIKSDAQKARKAAETIVLTPKTMVEEITAEKKVFRMKIVRDKKVVNYDDLPESLKKVHDQTVEAYKLQRSIHEKIKLMKEATDEERQPLVAELLKLDETVRENWKKIDAWDGKPDEPKGDTPPAPPVDETVKQINSAKKYITDNKKKLAAAIEAKDEKKVVKLTKGIQERVDFLIAQKQNFKPKSIDELKALGIKIS